MDAVLMKSVDIVLGQRLTFGTVEDELGTYYNITIA